METTLTCPKCGTENLVSAMNCSNCRINLAFALEHFGNAAHTVQGDGQKDNVNVATPPNDPKLVGIGGWLVFPAIGFVLGPILSMVSLVGSFVLLSDMSSRYGPYLFLSLGVEIGIFVYILIAANRFFRRKKSLPKTYINLMIANMSASLLLLLAAMAVGSNELATAEIKDFAKAAISSAIWIPYFMKSERVEATFTA